MGRRDPVLQPRHRPPLEPRRSLVREGSDLARPRPREGGARVLRQGRLVRAGPRRRVGGQSPGPCGSRGSGGCEGRTRPSFRNRSGRSGGACRSGGDWGVRPSRGETLRRDDGPSVPREGLRGNRGRAGTRASEGIRSPGLPGVCRVDRTGEGGHAGALAARGARARRWGSADGVAAIRAGDRAGGPQPGRLDGKRDRPPATRAVSGGPRGVRPRPRPQARPRTRTEVADDVRPSRGAGGGRVTVPRAAEERFLPSVDSLEAAMRAARRAADQGDVDGALRQLGIALHLKPEYDAAWLLRGHVLRRANDLEGALESFAQALKINGESEEYWMGLASALHGLGRLPEEVEAYDRIVTIHPRSTEAWIDKGAVLHELGDYAGAIACYDKVLAWRPEYVAAWNNKGAAFLRLGDEAANRVLLCQKQGRHGETVLWVDRALRIRDAPWLWYVKGLAHLGLSESTLAMKAFERTLASDPSLKEARAGLRKAKALREKVDFYRGAYECFGTHLPGDPGCAECEISTRCREVTP